jgi:hypothetical protein
MYIIHHNFQWYCQYIHATEYNKMLWITVLVAISDYSGYL